jgi:hypothetical protein
MVNTKGDVAMGNLRELVQREFDLGETTKSLAGATGIHRAIISQARHRHEIAPESASILRQRLEEREAKRQTCL